MQVEHVRGAARRRRKGHAREREHTARLCGSRCSEQLVEVMQRHANKDAARRPAKDAAADAPVVEGGVDLLEQKPLKL